MQRIEISPLFKSSQNNRIQHDNPLVKIFKITNDSVRPHMFVPLDVDKIDFNHYKQFNIQKQDMQPHINPTMIMISPEPVYNQLSPNLHRFQYVY